MGQIILEAPDTPEIRTHLLNTTLNTAQNFSNAPRIANEAESSEQGRQFSRPKPTLNNPRLDNEEEENKMSSEAIISKHQIVLCYIYFCPL